MSFVIRSFKTVREHWKKSVFFSLVIGYTGNRFKERIETNELMRVYCEEAQKYGDEIIKATQQPRTVTVILNPSSNKSKAKSQFEKYSAPILHLAGLSVDIILTESEGHAKTILDKIEQTDAIVIGGGDGTVSEVITGLLRRLNNDASKNKCPIGVLPLGRSNTLAKSLFPGGDKLSDVRSLAEATLAIVKQNTASIDLMKIEVQDESNSMKPIYAVDEIEWGVFRNAKALKDKYWYFGGLRNYATYIFNGSQFNSPCEAKLAYSLPCSGCKNCTIAANLMNRRWWHGLFGRPSENSTVSSVDNPKCSQFIEKDIQTTSIRLKTTNTSKDLDVDVPQLIINVGPESIDYFDFVRQGWKENQEVKENLSARQVQIKPLENDVDKSELSIDNENFELKPITVTLLPKAIKVFTTKST